MFVQPTGVEILDRVLGGLAPGLPCILAGPSGTGRTVLSLQLARATIEAGQVATILCSEPPSFLLQQAQTLGLDLEPAVRARQLVVLELDPAVSSTVRTCGVEGLVDAVRAEEPLASTLIVDPFTALTNDILDESALRQMARAFVERASPMRVVLTLESERLVMQQSLTRVLSEVCGAFVTLHRDDQSRRSLRVEKSRAGVGEAERLCFEIGSRGVVVVESTPPTESSLVVETSAPAPKSGDVVPVSSPAPSEKDPPVVLVVDHDDVTRKQVAAWLESSFEVITARDGFEAMTTLLTHRPDLVILDLVMPRVSGYELLSAFRRAAPSIPMLVVSGRVLRPADRLGPLVLGATDLLAKPVERFELLHKVDMLMRLSGSPQILMDPAEAEDLFGGGYASRRLSDCEFRARVCRACRFGERFGLPSSLVAVAAASTPALDAFVDQSDEGLRFEDAVHRVSKRRAVVLLVATEPADAKPVMERLLQRVEAQIGSAARLTHQILRAIPVEDDHDWRPLFRRLGDAPNATSEEGES